MTQSIKNPESCPNCGYSWDEKCRDAEKKEENLPMAATQKISRAELLAASGKLLPVYCGFCQKIIKDAFRLPTPDVIV